MAGSWGAALYGPVAQLPEAHDVRIDKHWYSAFRDTELHARLQAAGAVLRPKRKDGGDAIQRIPLVHGSLLRMDLETNRRWFHGIKQEADRQPRISLTFRHIGTWWNPSTGAVWGVGAPSASRAEAEVRAQARAARASAQRDLEDRAEAEQVYEPLEALFHDAAALSSGARTAIASALAGLDDELALWEARAAVSPFIAGDAFSIADCAFYPVLTYLRRRGLSLDRHPALDAYHARVAARPSAVASHPEGWEQGRGGRVNLFARAAVLSQRS